MRVRDEGMNKDNDAWGVQDEWEIKLKQRQNKMIQSIRKTWHARMKKQGIGQCMTRVAKVCARVGYVQCITKAWKLHMWGKVC